VRILNLTATRAREAPDVDTPHAFNVDVRLQEVQRTDEHLVVEFALTITAKPAVSKFQVEGDATVEGDARTLEAILATDPTTGVPAILNKVYQHVFTSIFILANLTNVPCPSPALLYSSTKSIAEVPREEEQPSTS